MDIVEQHIRNLPDDELVRMVRVDFEEYTDEALAYARDEMGKRGIPETAEAEAVTADGAKVSRPSVSIGDDTLEAFLREELQYQESCEAIFDFVTSMAIRSGEYEGQKIIIRKMNRDNFILYSEGENEEAAVSITGCAAIGKDELEALIVQVAEENGFTDEDDEGEALDGLIGEIEKFKK